MRETILPTQIGINMNKSQNHSNNVQEEQIAGYIQHVKNEKYLSKPYIV